MEKIQAIVLGEILNKISGTKEMTKIVKIQVQHMSPQTRLGRTLLKTNEEQVAKLQLNLKPRATATWRIYEFYKDIQAAAT